MEKHKRRTIIIKNGREEHPQQKVVTRKVRIQISLKKSLETLSHTHKTKRARRTIEETELGRESWGPSGVLVLGLGRD